MRWKWCAVACLLIWMSAPGWSIDAGDVAGDVEESAVGVDGATDQVTPEPPSSESVTSPDESNCGARSFDSQRRPSSRCIR